MRQDVQDSAKRWAPGCVNAAGKLRQKWLATAGTKSTKHGTHLLADLCMYAFVYLLENIKCKLIEGREGGLLLLVPGAGQDDRVLHQ